MKLCTRADPMWQWLGSPLAALRYIMYFGFMDDVTFGRNGPSHGPIPRHSLLSMNALFLVVFIIIYNNYIKCF